MATPGSTSPDTAPAGAAAAPRQSARFFDFSKVRELFGIDLRSIALLRVGLGLQIILDLACRWPALADHYSDWGLMPRHVLLQTYPSEAWYSLYMISGNSVVIGVLFAVNMLVALSLALGYRSRLSAILCYVFLISLEARNPLVTNGGDVLLRLLLFWAIFLPLGARWSVDHALAPDDFREATKTDTTHFSFASLGYLLQMCILYWFSAVLKFHPVWYEGRAVWYALNVDMFATPLALWLRQFTTILPLFTFMTLLAEIVAPLLAILGTRWFRLACALAMVTMHICFGLCLELGLFSWVAAIGWAAYVPTCFWDVIEARLSRKSRLMGLKLTVAGNDRSASRGLRLVREFLLPGSTPIEEGAAPLGRRWGVVDHKGRVMQGWPAARYVLRVSPLTSGTKWLFRLTPIDRLAAGLYHALAAFPGLLDRATGWMKPARVSTKPSWAGNLLAAAALVYILLWNFRGLPDDTKERLPWKWQMPDTWNPLILAVRLDQRWGMFAPVPLTADGWFVVPATLVNGDKVDLLTGDPIDFAKPALVSEHYIDQRWRKWMENLTWMGKDNMLAYGRYMVRWWNQQQTDPQRCVSTFHVVFVREDTTDRGIQPPRKMVLWNHNAINDDPPPTFVDPDPPPPSTGATMVLVPGAQPRATQPASRPTSNDEDDD